MPPRIHPPTKALTSTLRCRRLYYTNQEQHSLSAQIATESSLTSLDLPPPGAAPRLYPTTQPPSHKSPAFRKSQLLRQYTSLLRSTPLMILFQHNNLQSTEWVGIRRELNKALQKVDEARVAAGLPSENLAAGVKLQIIQTGIFATALRVVEFFKPELQVPDTSAPVLDASKKGGRPDAAAIKALGLTHSLSSAAHEASTGRKTLLSPLLSGPLAILTFPGVSPQHLKAALSILAPKKPLFPAPTKKANPGYHDMAVQVGLQKMLMLGARVEGKAFDVEGTRWVGGIDGGMEGLRGQLVAMLGGVGANLAGTLESASKSLYFTVEGRRTMMEEEEKGSATDEAVKAEEVVKTDV